MGHVLSVRLKTPDPNPPPPRYIREKALRRKIESLVTMTDHPTPETKAHNKALFALLRWLDEQP